MKQLALVSGMIIFVAGGLHAQELPRLIVEGSGGFTEPVGNTGAQLDTGWNVRGGFGVNFTQRLGVEVQADYSSMGINSTTLNNIGFPGGTVGIFSATLDPIIHLTPRWRHADVYAIGGGGLYHRNQQFTEPTVATFTAFDPFFGFYQAAVPTNQVVASFSENKIGINGGLGVEFGTRSRGKFFAEARWNRIFMGSYLHTDYMPVSFGFRW